MEGETEAQRVEMLPLDTNSLRARGRVGCQHNSHLQERLQSLSWELQSDESRLCPWKVGIIYDNE